MIAKMREEFETWARNSGEFDGEEDPFDWICYVKPDGTYYADSLELAWKAWQASRESLVIELPKVDYCQNPDADTDRQMLVRRKCRECVEAHGIKTK